MRSPLLVVLSVVRKSVLCPVAHQIVTKLVKRIRLVTHLPRTVLSLVVRALRVQAWFQNPEIVAHL